MTNEEIAYMNGKRAAYRLLLRTAFNDFGEEQPLDRWRIEKMETIIALRALCKAIGIDGLNDWGDEDYLPSIIENVILRAIQSTGLQIRARQQECERS
jgi:hypothetical protein